MVSTMLTVPGRRAPADWSGTGVATTTVLDPSWLSDIEFWGDLDSYAPAEMRARRIVWRGNDVAGRLLGFATDESGQDVVEYGLISATIAIVVLIGTTTFGSQIHLWFELLAGRITTTGT
jgi:Flp pilus assembly pilin Flp